MSEQNMDLMIPDAGSIPAYVKNTAAAKAANEDIASGLSTGFPARIKANGKQFVLVDGNGKETAFPNKAMVDGGDGNMYMPVIILKGKKTLTKTWYAGAYNPAAEGQAPECYSLDGERPDPSSLMKQSETCAACKQNAFGSGKDQAGNATKGKACTDNKVLAAFVPNFGVHQLKIMPASLKNFGLYVKQLTSNSIPVDKVKTLMTFDPTTSFPVYVFRFGGFIPEQFIPKLDELAASQEVEDIIHPQAWALAVTKEADVAEAPAQQKLQQAAPAPPEPSPAQAEVMDDLGLGDIAKPDPVQNAKPAEVKEQAPAPQPADEVSDEDLINSLGLG